MGARFKTDRLTASVTGYTAELRDAIQRRTIVFLRDVTGVSIGGFEVVRQDAVGRAFTDAAVAQMVTRVNIARVRIRGLKAETTVRFARDWLA